MKLAKIAVLVIAVLSISALANAYPTGQMANTAASNMRTTAVLTTADVLGTTMTWPTNATRMHVYVLFDKGSLTSARVAPAGNISGNPLAADYYINEAKSQSLTADAKGPGVHMVFEKEDFGASRYVTCAFKGVGTVTSSGISATYKFETPKP